MIKLLLVEDDSELRFIFERILNLKGYYVTETAANGEEAIKKFNAMNPKPDFILMDYNMPGKDGIQAMQEILKIEKSAKIIIMSANPLIKEKVMSSGAILFSEKQFPIERMIHDIKQRINDSNLCRACC
ncbi:MAG: response regulator [Candidatus Lokiarchaeota archaeon]|nr:response regulator [Candidatus Lokiarchaeota archaeon]MBD3342477.1 response regulator [Candidatus Lokiarchaeota archaeon]